jgi:hypothetical protein
VKLRDLRDDQPLSLPDAAAYLGRMTGQKPHVSTLWRWCLKGCKGVTLQSVCIGGKRFVTVAAIEVFVESLSAARAVPNHKQTPQPITPAALTSPLAHVMRHNDRRKGEIEAARRRLDELTGVQRLAPGVSATTDAIRSA